MSDASPSEAAFVRVAMRQGQAQIQGRASWESTPLPRDPKAATIRGAWHWDGARLCAQVDRFGFYNLYCYEKDGEVALSPSLLELVAQGCDATPDAAALAVFHRMGIFLHDETPLKHVRTLPPDARLTWQAGRLRIEGGVQMPRATQITRDAAVEGMVEHFRTAMRRILGAWEDEFILPLSGGRDSRHILLEMLHQGRHPRACVTFHHNGARMNAEAQAARLVAGRAGVPHDVLGHARPRLADTLRALVMTGLCADEHAQMMPLHDYMLGTDAAAFDGIAGDILTNPDNDAERFFRLAETGDFTAIGRALCEGHGRVVSQPGQGQGAGPILSPGRDAEVHERIGQAVADYADAPDPYQVFWLYHRTRREINFVPQSILAPAKTVFCPYLDEAFARFCLSLPYTVTCDQQLHNDAIARAYPGFADIPYHDQIAPVPLLRGSLRHRLRSLGDVARITRRLRAAGCAARAGDFLRAPAQLTRRADAVYRLHALCLDGLDAARARALLDIAADLQAARPRRLISDRLEADG